MRRAAGSWVVAAVFALIGPLGVVLTQPPEATPPLVVLLFSLRSTAPAILEVERAFRDSLEAGYGGPVDLHVEHLDLPGTSAGTYRAQLVELLTTKYAGRQVDLVVPFGSDALSFVLDSRDSAFPTAPVVFSDVSREALEALGSPLDITGALVVLDRQRTVSTALDLHPGASRLVVVAGASAGDRRAESLVLRLAKAHKPGIDIVSLVGQPLDEQLRALARLPEGSVVIFGSYRADSLGRSMVAADVLRLVTRASNAPVYGAVRHWLGDGMVGGDLIQYDELAQRAAGLAARVLRGEDPATIPPTAEPSSRLMFDARELQRWGIDEDLLPDGSEVLFREPSVWSEYGGAILGAVALVLAQAALIGALLVERRNRRRAEGDIREAEQRYRTVADFTFDWEYWRLPDGSFGYVSPSCIRITGHDATEFYRRPALLDDLVIEEDRSRWTEHRERARSGGEGSRLEYRIRNAAGGIVWIDHVCSPVRREDGRFLGVRGSNRDITARKRAEDELRRALAEIERLRAQLETDNTYLREIAEPEPGFEGIIGRSTPLLDALSKVRQVAPTSSTVLLLGETGVGKELFAHALHSLSPRCHRPLVKVNCAALPSALIESELFGHERGAFTGAIALRKGRFEIADGTTLFLDEIGDFPLELQAKLLRVLQNGEFERVGGTSTLRANVRMVAATNRRLDDDVRTGRFREDLWFRLNIFPITVPPLRERLEDILPLTQHFIDKHCRKLGRPALQVSETTVRRFQAHDWPGNVRELETVVERAVISSRGPSLQVDLGGPLANGAQAPKAGSPRTLADVERDHIVATLVRTSWRVDGEGGAAEALGLNPSTLRSRMLKHGIRRPGTAPR